MVSKLAKHVDNETAKQQFGNGYWYGNRTAYNRFARACAEAAVQEHAQLQQQQQAQQQVRAHGRQHIYTNWSIEAWGAWGRYAPRLGQASPSAAVALCLTHILWPQAAAGVAGAAGAGAEGAGAAAGVHTPPSGPLKTAVYESLVKAGAHGRSIAGGVTRTAA